MQANKKTITGVVISNKMEKTVVVTVSRKVRHPLFKKYYTKRNKYKAHDAKSECGLGDTVVISECRPLSRDKRWVVTQVVSKALIA